MTIVTVDTAYAEALAEQHMVGIVEAVEAKFMPKGKTFSEDQYDKVSSEVWYGIKYAVAGLDIDTEDVDV